MSMNYDVYQVLEDTDVTISIPDYTIVYYPLAVYKF